MEALESERMHKEESECDPALIEQVREICRLEFKKNPNEFEIEDVKSTLNNDWSVVRFLLAQKCQPVATSKMLLGTLRWRRKAGFAKWKPSRFPAEFYNFGVCFPFGPDKMGNTIIWVRLCFLDTRVNCTRELIRDYIIYVVDEVDRKLGGKKWSVVYDCRNTGIFNCDLNFSSFMICEVIPHLPRGLEYILIYNLPWGFGKIMNATLVCAPSEFKRIVKVGEGKNIYDYIDRESLPDFLGGTCSVEYRTAPDCCVNFEDMAAERNWTEKDLQAIAKYYKPHFEDLRKRSLVPGYFKKDLANKSLLDGDNSSIATSGILEDDNSTE